MDMYSCFAFLGARQHFVQLCVAKICNASPRGVQEPTHINCKMTCSLYQVPYFELTCGPNTRCHITCFRAQKDQSVTIGVSKTWLEKQKINVAGAA